MGAKLNLVGNKFSKLLVQAETEDRVSGSVVWGCLCDLTIEDSLFRETGRK